MYLSIIITAHEEGMVLGRTIRSLLACIERAKSIKCDLLINIDKGNKETIKAANEFLKNDIIRINYTDYGDVGLARNFAIRMVKGEYVMMIDADDVVSSNWLSVGMKLLLKTPYDVVVHPESEIRFDKNRVQSCVVREEYESTWHETLALIEGNRWCSVVMGKRKVFKKHRYPKNRDGFGYEDYLFNCSLTQAGIRHLVAKNTVVFCLQKEKSVSTKTHRDEDVLPYTPLFDLKKLQKKMKILGLPELSPGKERHVPEVVETEIKQLCVAEKDLKEVFKDELKKVTIGFSGNNTDLTIGESFCRMFASLNLRFMPLILDFSHGDGNRIRRLVKLMIWRVIANGEFNSGSSDNELRVDFWNYFGAMPLSVKNEMISRLVFQVRPKRIIVDDGVASWAKKHKKALEEYGISVRKK